MTASLQQTQGEDATQPHGLSDLDDSAFDLSFLPIRKIFTLIFIHDLEHNQVIGGPASDD